MGAIRLIDQLHSTNVNVVMPPTLTDIDAVYVGKPILNDAVPITLAEYNLESKDAITAHRLKDYRQRRFRLALLPRCDLLYDKVLEGSDYWRELLQSKSSFS